MSGYFEAKERGSKMRRRKRSFRLSGILDYHEFEDIEDGDFPSSSMFTGMKRWFVQKLQQSDS